MAEASPKYGRGSLSERERARRDELLNPAAVAAVAGCSRNTVHMAIARGDLEATPVHGPGGVSSWVVRRAVAEAWRPRAKGRPRQVAKI